jgi:hypothetical protein
MIVLTGDVWSFAVLLMELFTHELPYATMQQLTVVLSLFVLHSLSSFHSFQLFYT